MTKVLKIGLLMQGSRNWIGGSEYIKNIILALGSLPAEVRSTFEVSIFYRSGSLDQEIFDQLKSFVSHTYDIDAEFKLFSLLERLELKIKGYFDKESNHKLERLISRKNIDFIYPFYVNKTAKFHVDACSWIPDFQHKYLPYYFSDVEIENRDKNLARIANSSLRVVLSSETAANDFRKFFPNSECKIEVLSFATLQTSNSYKSDPLLTINKYKLPDKFFLISNQFWQHKNHMLVFEALKLLHKKLIKPTIVCTGHVYDYRKPEYIDTILQTIAMYELSNQISLLGLIPKFDQVQLMRHSIAVIQPSLFEGWSTVIEDARCLNKKMILSDLAVHLEQNPPGSVFFDRNSAQKLADRIHEFWTEFNPESEPEKEKLLFTINEENFRKFGYSFLKIAHNSSKNS